MMNISADDISGDDNMEKNISLTEGVYYILLSLLTPNHGYGIIQNTLHLTGGRVELGAGTLYGAINNLLEKQWIALYSEDKQSRKKKDYVITEEGREVLKQEIIRLSELVKNGEASGIVSAEECGRRLL